jgi:UDP-glucose 4-epimerase
VDDLARGHLLALEFIQNNAVELTLNFGTGKPYSVLEVIAAFEKASGIKIPYEFRARRPGDLSQYYADPSKAYEILGWKAIHGIERMCEDAWRWQQKNPNGYEAP